MADTDHDAFLEDLFSEAREDAPLPDALTARILADAQDALPAPAAPPKRSVWRSVFADIGGWPAMAGLATATVAGLWIGIAQPIDLDTLTYTADATDLTDYFPDYAGLFEDI